MVDYLDRIGAGLIIAHPERLDFDFVPEELVGREAIQRELASKFSNVATPEGAARAVITGPVITARAAPSGEATLENFDASSRWMSSRPTSSSGT